MKRIIMYLTIIAWMGTLVLYDEVEFNKVFLAAALICSVLYIICIKMDKRADPARPSDGWLVIETDEGEMRYKTITDFDTCYLTTQNIRTMQRR